MISIFTTLGFALLGAKKSFPMYTIGMHFLGVLIGNSSKENTSLAHFSLIIVKFLV